MDGLSRSSSEPAFQSRPRGSHSDLRGRRRHLRCRHCRRQVRSHGVATAVAVNPGVAGAVAAAGGPAAIAGWSRVAVAGVPGVAVAGAAAPARVVRAVARVTSVAVRSAVAIAVTVLPPLPEPGPEPPGLPRRRCGGFPAQPLPVPGHRHYARRRFRRCCCRRHCRRPVRNRRGAAAAGGIHGVAVARGLPLRPRPQFPLLFLPPQLPVARPAAASVAVATAGIPTFPPLEPSPPPPVRR